MRLFLTFLSITCQDFTIFDFSGLNKSTALGLFMTLQVVTHHNFSSEVWLSVCTLTHCIQYWTFQDFTSLHHLNFSGLYKWWLCKWSGTFSMHTYTLHNQCIWVNKEKIPVDARYLESLITLNVCFWLSLTKIYPHSCADIYSSQIHRQRR